jgi:type VI secretion system secreted protein Hcp
MAVVDFFLKIDGMEGESQDSKHKGEIELDSWSLGAQQAGTAATGGGGGAGKVKWSDFRFVSKCSKGSPKLALACANGEHIKKAVLICRKAGKDQQEYLKLTMTDILVTSYQMGGPNGGNVLPTDQVSLDYAKIEMEYKEQKSDGTLGAATKAGWDLKANKPL